MKNIFFLASIDIKNRLRNPSFITTLIVTVLTSFFFIPKNNQTIQVMQIAANQFIQIGNPSWMPYGSAFGLTLFFPLYCFFYLKNSLVIEEKYDIDKWVKISAINKTSYFISKLLSNIFMIYMLLFIVIVATFFYTIIKFPGEWLSFYDFFTPFVPFFFSSLIICAMALLFQSNNTLRGAIGSFVIIFFDFAVFIIEMLLKDIPALLLPFDFTCHTVIMKNIRQTVFEATGQTEFSFTLIGKGTFNTSGTEQLYFHGINISASEIVGYVILCVLSLLITHIAACDYFMEEDEVISESHSNDGINVIQSLTSLYKPDNSSKSFIIIGVIEEFKILVHGRSFIAWAFFLGIFIVSVFIPMSTLIYGFIPLLYLWFIKSFSMLGSYQHKYKVLSLLCTIPKGNQKQILYSWLAGIVLSALITFPALIKLIIGLKFKEIIIYFAAVIFIPSLALLFGELTKGQRLFEIVMMFYIYVFMVNAQGYFHHNPPSILKAVIYIIVSFIMVRLTVYKRSFSFRHVKI